MNNPRHIQDNGRNDYARPQNAARQGNASPRPQHGRSQGAPGNVRGYPSYRQENAASVQYGRQSSQRADNARYTNQMHRQRGYGYPQEGSSLGRPTAFQPQYPVRKKRRGKIIIGAIALVVIIGICVAAFALSKTPNEQKAGDTIVEVSENTATVPQSQPDTRLLVSDSLNLDKPTEHVVYLTFDDGPSANTDRIIATLKEKGAVATWFIKGNSESLSKVKDIWESGNQVAIHTYNHDYQSIYASESAFWNDIEKTAAAIEEVLGFAPPKLLRFPGGSFNNFNRDIAERLTDSTGERGWHYFDWNVSCGDGSENPYTPEEIYGFVVGEAEGNNSSCVLMHDSDAKNSTADALGSIIDYFREQGYTFKVLDAESFGYHF